MTPSLSKRRARAATETRRSGRRRSSPKICARKNSPAATSKITMVGVSSVPHHPRVGSGSVCMKSSAPPARHSRGPILVEIALTVDLDVDCGAVRVARRVALRQATGLDPNIERRMRCPIEEARLDADLCRITIGDGVARAIVALLLRNPSCQLASYGIGDQVMV